MSWYRLDQCWKCAPTTVHKDRLVSGELIDIMLRSAGRLVLLS